MKFDLKVLGTGISVLFAVIFWFYTINGLPPRVAKLEVAQKDLEQKLNDFSNKLERMDTKVDLMLQSIHIIQTKLIRGAE
jgi:hypothetical protein